jgi:hypothetical protein
MTSDRRPPTDPLAVLEDEGLSLLVLRDTTEQYRSYDGGVRPLLELVEWFPGGLDGSVVADRIVGACAARIFEYLQVAKVHALTGSISAERILHAAAIPFSFRVSVVDILNRDGTGRCPFEQLAALHSDPRGLIPAIRAKVAELRASR